MSEENLASGDVMVLASADDGCGREVVIVSGSQEANTDFLSVLSISRRMIFCRGEGKALSGSSLLSEPRPRRDALKVARLLAADRRVSAALSCERVEVSVGSLGRESVGAACALLAAVWAALLVAIADELVTGFISNQWAGWKWKKERGRGRACSGKVLR